MKNWRYCTVFILLIFGVAFCVIIADARDNIFKSKSSHNQVTMSQVYTQNDEEQKGQTGEGQMGRGDEGQQGQAEQGQMGQGDEGQQDQADEGQESE